MARATKGVFAHLILAPGMLLNTFCGIKLTSALVSISNFKDFPFNDRITTQRVMCTESCTAPIKAASSVD